MDTISKGRLGYNLVERMFLMQDWEIYVPVLENTKIDCIVIKTSQLFRCQIKTIGYDKKYNSYYLPVRKINHNQGEYKIHQYSNAEIDYFIGVDVDKGDLYIVPINFIKKYKSSIAISTLQPFKNNFSQLEPQQRDLLSADDDIGESLIANTEGRQ